MGKQNTKVSLNKRLLYLLLFLFIVTPIIVGVLVWHFTSINCPDTMSGPTTAMTPSKPEPWKNLRLPRYVVPVHYDITLYPDFLNGNGWFYGNESIKIEIKAETSFILIHFYYMNITKTTLREKGTSNPIEIKRTFQYAANQFWVVETKQPLKEGSVVVLDLQFDGSLTRAIVGLYKSTYVNSITKERRYLSASKFEPVSARRAFPCFDEPNIKAEYTIRLVHDGEYTALSNMPDVSTTVWQYDGSLMVTEFQRSVKMSTYLVCFIVCDFKYLNATTKFGTQVRTFATPDRVNQTGFALQVAVESMELYEELFNVKYPLPKQDMIAIPDFVSGAMEHWGLITYRETAMLFDPMEASSDNQQRVAVVVAHEISHQWFGNIVTMDWWDDLWLNEGFASFMEYLGADKSEPGWKMIEQFITEDVQRVMITDAGVSSHPIVVSVQNPSQINEVFDSISYSKGASVIRMLESIIGKDKFFKGVEAYLKEFRWANAKTDDLWNHLGKIEDDLTVKAVMDTWTRQMGFPIINVTFDQTQNKATATQARFLAESTTNFDPDESPYRYRWYVHLDYITSSSVTGKTWMKKEDTVTFDIPVNPVTTDSWIKFNSDQTGFYRVNYPDTVWRKLATALNNNASIMKNTDKSGLLDDAFNLARGGYLDYDVALDMIKYLDKEENYVPWKSVLRGINYIKKMFIYHEEFGNWTKYVVAKLNPVLNKVGWDDTGTHLEKRLRINIITVSCDYGDSDCLGNATERFRKWIDDENFHLPPNTRALVYRFGMQMSNRSSDWDVMFQRYLSGTIPQEQVKLLYGLSQTQSTSLLQRYLDYARNQTLIRSQDFFTVLAYISYNPVGRELVWNWIKSNWGYLVDRFTTFSRALGRAVPTIISDFNTESLRSDVVDFFNKYPDAGAGARGRAQALESIDRNIIWMKKYRKTISDWLCKQMANC